ncbi:MAG: hypothetical protein AB7D00_03645 [Rhodospirillaceae bacterium]
MSRPVRTLGNALPALPLSRDETHRPLLRLILAVAAMAAAAAIAFAILGFLPAVLEPPQK